jgi:hypothetical protein
MVGPHFARICAGMRRLLISFGSTLVFFLVFAPDTFAFSTGQGFWGPTDDKTITNFAFATIIFFVVLVLVLSLVQGSLERRKKARLAAAKARNTDSTWQGGW